MTPERESPQSNSEKNWKQELQAVIDNPLTRPQFEDVRTSRINEIPGLTLAFLPKKSYLKREPAINNGNGHLKFGGIEGLFDSRLCIGVCVANEGEEDEIYSQARSSVRSINYGIPLHDKVEIAVVRPQDLPLWLRFYQHVEKEKLLQSVGQRVFATSGLSRQDRRVHESQMVNFGNILSENSEYLSKCGVTKQGPDEEFGMDLAFFAKDAHVAVPIAHLQASNLNGGILVDSVLDKRVLCPGFVIRNPWETKREAHDRAMGAKSRFIHEYRSSNIDIPVVSAGQNSLWKKLGFAHELGHQINSAKLPVESVIRFLYLGQDRIHPGPFTLSGLSLPPQAQGLGVDILLVNRKPDDMNFTYSTVDDIYGYFYKRGFAGEGRWVRGEVDNVGGIIIVPDGWQDMPGVLEKIDVAKRVLGRYFQHSKDVKVMPLDRSLFEDWIHNRSPFVKKGGISVRKFENPYGSKRIPSVKEENVREDGTFLGIFQQGTQIGGVQMALAQRTNGDTSYNIIDMGGVYAHTPQAYQELTARPTTASGLKIDLELQGMPMVPGILYPEYLLQTARGLGNSLTHPENLNPVASYIRSELAHRFTIAELRDVFGPKKAQDIVRLGRFDEADWYAKGNHHLNSVTITHAHDDHDRGTFALDEAAFIMRRQTLAFLEAKTEKAATWRQRILETSLIMHPKNKNAFKRRPREVFPIDFNGQRVDLGGGLLENLYLVNHSIPGTGAPFFQSKDGSIKTVLYTADVRQDESGYTKKMVERVAGKADIIIVDSTNPLLTDKASVGVTEKDVKQSLSKVFSTYDRRPVIILTPWNNLERLNSILEVAGDRRRKVAFGYDHWEAYIQMAAEKEVAPGNAEGFDIPIPQIGEDAALWMRFSTQPLRYQDALQNLAQRGRLGILTSKQLQEEAGEWVVVTSPYRLLMKDFNDGFWPRRAAVVYSSPFPYAINQKFMAAANKSWAEGQANGNFIADFEVFGNGGRVASKISRFGALAASGHNTYKQNLQLFIDLLDGKYKGKEIVVIHGEHTLNYAQMIERDLASIIGLKNQSDLKITGKLNTYSPSSPLKRKGHWIRLD